MQAPKWRAGEHAGEQLGWLEQPCMSFTHNLGARHTCSNIQAAWSKKPEIEFHLPDVQHHEDT